MMRKLNSLHYSSIQVWQTFNALFIIRCLIKYIIETGSEYQLLQHFEALPNDSAVTQSTDDGATSSTHTATNEIELAADISIVPIDGCKFESFFDAVVNMIVVIPVKYASFWEVFIDLSSKCNHLLLCRREFTYHLHLEAVNTILVLFSLHLFSNQPAEKATIFK